MTISSEWVTIFSPDFPVKDSWEFPRIFRKIVTWETSAPFPGDKNAMRTA